VLHEDPTWHIKEPMRSILKNLDSVDESIAKMMVKAVGLRWQQMKTFHM